MPSLNQCFLEKAIEIVHAASLFKALDHSGDNCMGWACSCSYFCVG